MSEDTKKKKPEYIWSQDAVSVLARFLILYKLNESGTLNILELQDAIKKELGWSPSYQLIHTRVWEMIDEGHIIGGHFNLPNERQNKKVDLRITDAGKARLARALQEVAPIFTNTSRFMKAFERSLNKVNPNWKEESRNER